MRGLAAGNNLAAEDPCGFGDGDAPGGYRDSGGYSDSGDGLVAVPILADRFRMTLGLAGGFNGRENSRRVEALPRVHIPFEVEIVLAQ